MKLANIWQKINEKSMKIEWNYCPFSGQNSEESHNKITYFSMKSWPNFERKSMKFLINSWVTPWLKFIENQLFLIINSLKINENLAQNWVKLTIIWPHFHLKLTYFWTKSWPKWTTFWIMDLGWGVIKNWDNILNNGFPIRGHFHV